MSFITKSFKEYLEEQDLEDRMIIEDDTENNVSDNSNNEDQKPNDSDDDSDEQQSTNTQADTQEKRNKIDNGKTMKVLKTFSIDSNFADPEEKLADLEYKALIIKKTILNLMNMITASRFINGAETNRKNPTMLINVLKSKSIAMVRDEWEKDFYEAYPDFEKARNVVSLNKKFRSISSKKRAENLTNAYKDLENESESFGDSIDEALNFLKTDSDIANSRYNKYNSSTIITTIRKESKDKKNGFDVDSELLGKIYKTFESYIMTAINRGKKTALNNINHTLGLIHRYTEKGKYIRQNDNSFFATIRNSLYNAYSSLIVMADSVNSITSEYQKTLSIIRRELDNRYGKNKKALNTLNSRLARRKAEAKAADYERTKEAQIQDIEQSMASKGDALQIFIKLVKKSEKEIVDYLNKYSKEEDIANIKAGYIAYQIASKNDKSKVLNGADQRARLSKYFNKYWNMIDSDRLSIKQMKDEVTSDIEEKAKSERRSKYINSLIKKPNMFPSDASSKPNEEPENEMKAAPAGAKDFDGEEPKNIFDYAIKKARKNIQ